MAVRGGAFSRWFARFTAGESWLKRAILKLLYYVFIVLPYPLRRVASAGFIVAVLAMKKLVGVEKRNDPTPLDEVGTNSFWGVPKLDVSLFTLSINGLVESPLTLPFEQILELPAVERQVRMDCVGGFRNNTVMKGLPLSHLWELVRVREGAQRAVFYCADGYYESIPLAELRQHQAFLVYQVNGQH